MSTLGRTIPFLMLVAVAAPALANMAAPVQPGVALGEPQAELGGLVVERERLQIDLRPLALEPDEGSMLVRDDGRALISALYHVRNDSAERTVTLEFLAHALDSMRWTVEVDGRRIGSAYRAASGGTARSLPPTTPALGGAPLVYEAGAPGIIHFDAVIPPGRHTIRVEYVAEPTRQVVDHPLVHWQLAYLLAPARSWPSFGTLEVSILAPEGWSVATEPRMKRIGDSLGARFDGIPADALTITARARYAWWYPVLAWLPAAAALVLGTIGAWRLGRTLGRRLVRNDRGPAWALPAALGVGFVLAVAVPVAGLAGAAIEEGLIGAGQGAWGSYDFFFLELLVGLVAFIAGIVAVQIGAVRAISRARRRYDARWIEAYPSDEEHPRAIHTNGVVKERQR